MLILLPFRVFFAPKLPIFLLIIENVVDAKHKFTLVLDSVDLKLGTVILHAKTNTITTSRPTLCLKSLFL